VEPNSGQPVLVVDDDEVSESCRTDTASVGLPNHMPVRCRKRSSSPSEEPPAAVVLDLVMP
jgi:hypothetical protein